VAVTLADAVTFAFEASAAVTRKAWVPGVVAGVVVGGREGPPVPERGCLGKQPGEDSTH